MRLLKRIVEMVFIFLVPLMLLLFGLKINKVYDENNNLTSQYLTYENGIFREYNGDYQYENILYKNEILQNNLLNNENRLYRWVSNSPAYAPIEYDPINNAIKQTFNSNPSAAYIGGIANGTTFNYIKGHTYLLQFSMLSTINTQMCFYAPGFGYYQPINVSANTWTTYQKLIYISSSGSSTFNYFNNNNTYMSFTTEDYILYKDFQIVDLSVMFGSNYIPSIEDFNNYTNNSIIDYGDSSDIVIQSNDLISDYYNINYTWYNNALVSLSEHLQFNNNFMIQFIFMYLILIMLNLLLWYVFYVPFDMLFGLLLRKLEYYK